MSDILAHLPPDEPLPAIACDSPGVTLATIDMALATLVAGRDTLSLAAAFQARLDIRLPDGPKTSSAGVITLIGIGPGRWTVAAEGVSGDALLEQMQVVAGPHAAVTDQSDASVVFEISGPKAPDTLMKLLLIDVDSLVPGSAATTQAALIGTTLWRTGSAYRFLIARSYALAFERAVAVSAAEFGFAFA